jgi:hypothetical protein
MCSWRCCRRTATHRSRNSCIARRVYAESLCGSFVALRRHAGLCCRAYRASRMVATPACDTCANRHRTTLKIIEIRCIGDRLESCHRHICSSGADLTGCTACAAARTNGNPRLFARAALRRATAERLFWNGRRLYACKQTTSDLASGLARIDSVLAAEFSFSARRAGVRARAGLSGARRRSACLSDRSGCGSSRRSNNVRARAVSIASASGESFDVTRFILTGACRPRDIRAVAATPAVNHRAM